MSMVSDGLYQYGGAPVGLPVTIGGNGVGTYYFVDPTNGSDGNTGKTIKKAFASLDKAYDAVTSNNNDVIVLGTNATHTINGTSFSGTDSLTVSKSRVNILAADLPGRIIQQGAKVTVSSSSTEAFVIKNTGTRNSFKGLKVIQNSTNAAALTAFQDGGEGTLLDHCSFTFGVADNLDQTDAYEILTGADSATYQYCTFGSDTLVTSAARTVMALDQVTTSQEFKSNLIKECYFQINSSTANANFVRVLATDGVKFTNIFDRCIMTNALVASSASIALDDAVDSIAGLVEGTLLFYMCAADSTEFCTGVSTHVKTFAPVTSPAGGEAGTPS